MNKFCMLLCILMVDRAASEEKWFCVDSQAMRQDNIMSVCGIGTSLGNEGEARANALKNAMDEFKILCSLSSDCRGRKVNIEPKRSTCFEKKLMSPDNSYSYREFTCHRMFVFTILEGK